MARGACQSWRPSSPYSESSLLDDARSWLRARRVRALWILSDPGAEAFYRCRGAVRVGMHPSDAIPGRRLPWLRLSVQEAVPTLATERLRLRLLAAPDLAALADLNADPEVVRYLAGPLTRAQSDALARRVQQHWQLHGFGPWAVERRESHNPCFLGFVGLWVPSFHAPFTPCIEVLWRLGRVHWGCGLATEAARAAVQHGFARLGLEEIVSFTARENAASRRVMEKLGMQRDAAGDFEHPDLPEAHPQGHHVLYRLRSPGCG